jgi:hypothetical protein
MGAATGEQRSGVAQGLLYAGGIAGIYALFVAFSAVTGQRFEIPNDGGGRGIPLPSSWFHTALFTAVGVVLWLAGQRWDRPGFVAFRARRPWLVPTVVGVVIVPATIVVLFLLVS